MFYFSNYFGHLVSFEKNISENYDEQKFKLYVVFIQPLLDFMK